MNEWEEKRPGNWFRDDGAFIIEFNEQFFAWDASSNQYGPYKTLEEAQEKVCPF